MYKFTATFNTDNYDHIKRIALERGWSETITHEITADPDAPERSHPEMETIDNPETASDFLIRDLPQFLVQTYLRPAVQPEIEAAVAQVKETAEAQAHEQILSQIVVNVKEGK